METQSTQPEFDNKKYVFSILRIILLTNIPAFIILISDFKSGIGWITGSFASGVNFYLMARRTLSLSDSYLGASVKGISKFYAIRYLLLIIWSVLVIMLLKPELIVYCLALLSAQFAVVVYQVYCFLRYGKLTKYFDRGNDE
jgi:hypothetical protein